MHLDLLSEGAVRAWALASLVMVLKMMAVAIRTSMIRIRKKVYISPEDYEFQGQPVGSEPDPDVERMRRILQNDLENVVPFVVAGFIYALSDPSSRAAAICFIGFPLARILHTLFYVRSLMPHRTLAFMVGFLITLWMALASLGSSIF